MTNPTDPQAFEAARSASFEWAAKNPMRRQVDEIFLAGRTYTLREDPVVRAMAEALEEYDAACVPESPATQTTAWRERWEAARTGLTNALAAYRESVKKGSGE